MVRILGIRMAEGYESESRKLLGRLRTALAEENAGQARLDSVVTLIASSMRAEASAGAVRSGLRAGRNRRGPLQRVSST